MVAVGVAMSVFYAFAVEPLDRDRPIAMALAFAAMVWIANAAVVLPLTGEGFAGSAHLTFAGMAWFAAAHTLFFVAAALIYRALEAVGRGAAPSASKPPIAGKNSPLEALLRKHGELRLHGARMDVLVKVN